MRSTFTMHQSPQVNVMHRILCNTFRIIHLVFKLRQPNKIISSYIGLRNTFICYATIDRRAVPNALIKI